MQYKNTPVNEAISERKLFQSVIVYTSTIEADEFAKEVAASGGWEKELVSSILTNAGIVAKRNLAKGFRVEFGNVCHIELFCTGGFESKDAPWDEKKNKLVARPVLYPEIRDALKGITPTNIESPARPRILGVQDKETFAQDTIVKGGTVLIEGDQTKLNPDQVAAGVEGVFLRSPEGDEYALECISSTHGKIDCECSDASIPAGENYTLVLRGRDGKSTDYMVVETTRGGIRVVEA